MIDQNDLVIRRAESADAAALTAISFAAKRYWQYPESYYDAWKNELTIDENYILKNMVYVALIRNVPVGYYSIAENEQDETYGAVFVGKGFWMDHIFINPEYINQGIGSRLVHHMEKLCSDMNIAKIMIFVDPHASGFYEKIGATFMRMSASNIEGREIQVYEMRIKQGQEKHMSFNERAASWDDESRIKRALIVADEIRKTVPLNTSWTGLEFGCGTGLISFNLAGELGKITMIDVSEGMIGVCLKKIAAGGFEGVRALHADIEMLVEKGERFDFLYSSMALHHVADIDDIIEKFKKVLSADGTVCIVDLNSVDRRFHESEPGFDGHHGFNQEELKDLFKAHGFHSCASHTFYRDVKKTDGTPVEFSLFLMTGRLQA